MPKRTSCKQVPEIAKTFPLAESAEAHPLLEEGHVRGELVLEIG